MQQQSSADIQENAFPYQVLVVDDDENWVFVSRKMIKRIGVHDQNILTAKNGLEALQLLKHLQGQGAPLPAFIFLDIKMPVLDGFGFLKQAFSGEEVDVQHTKIYLCSSSSHSGDKERASHYPIAGFFTKPLTMEILTEVLS